MEKNKDKIQLISYQIGCLVTNDDGSQTMYELSKSEKTLLDISKENLELFLTTVEKYMYATLIKLEQVLEDLEKIKYLEKELGMLNFFTIEDMYNSIIRTCKDELYNIGPNIAYCGIIRGKDYYTNIENTWTRVREAFNTDNDKQIYVFNGKIVGRLPENVFENTNRSSVLWNRACVLSTSHKDDFKTLLEKNDV